MIHSNTKTCFTGFDGEDVQVPDGWELLEPGDEIEANDKVYSTSRKSFGKVKESWVGNEASAYYAPIRKIQ